jgi:hypothetical protein
MPFKIRQNIELKSLKGVSIALKKKKLKESNSTQTSSN